MNVRDMVKRRLLALVCAIAGHDYRVVRSMNSWSRKVACNRCGCVWGMHDPTRSFVLWDGELEEMYRRAGQWDPGRRAKASPQTPSPE